MGAKRRHRPPERQDPHRRQSVFDARGAGHTRRHDRGPRRQRGNEKTAWAMMTPRAFEALKIANDADLPQGAKLEKDAQGKPTGVVTGNMVPVFDLLPKPTFEEQVEGTKEFFRELNRLGLTGVVDPGGNNVLPQDYQALFKVWRDGQLTIRMAYSLNGMTPGSEFEEYKNYLAMMPMGFGDDMLHFN